MKILMTIILCAMMAQTYAGTKTICGSDDRILSTNPKVARILKVGARAGCTATLIGKSCVISAGHCNSTFVIAEFNTPESRGGRIQSSLPEDRYEVISDSIVYKDGGYGNDYAVMRLNKNALTGKYPGDVQGNYEVGTELVPVKGDMIRITGYGRDASDPIRNFAQQSNFGPVYEVNGATLKHRADTMGGNSGSSVIHEETGKIIGIHTHGGCSSSRSSANSSTLIAKRPEFVKAIKACLAFEANNL